MGFFAKVQVCYLVPQRGAAEAGREQDGGPSVPDLGHVKTDYCRGLNFYQSRGSISEYNIAVVPDNSPQGDVGTYLGLCNTSIEAKRSWSTSTLQLPSTRFYVGTIRLVPANKDHKIPSATKQEP